MAAFPLVLIELVQMTQYGRRRRSSVDCHCHDNHHCHTTTSLLPGSLLHLQVRSTGPTIKETEVMWLGSFWAHPKPLSPCLSFSLSNHQTCQFGHFLYDLGQQQHYICSPILGSFDWRPCSIWSSWFMGSLTGSISNFLSYFFVNGAFF